MTPLTIFAKVISIFPKKEQDRTTSVTLIKEDRAILWYITGHKSCISINTCEYHIPIAKADLSWENPLQKQCLVFILISCIFAHLLCQIGVAEEQSFVYWLWSESREMSLSRDVRGQIPLVDSAQSEQILSKWAKFFQLLLL